MWAKVAGVHGGHGVVGKKQSELKDKLLFVVSMVLLLKIVMV